MLLTPEFPPGFSLPIRFTSLYFPVDASGLQICLYADFVTICKDLQSFGFISQFIMKDIFFGILSEHPIEAIHPKLRYDCANSLYINIRLFVKRNLNQIPLLSRIPNRCAFMPGTYRGRFLHFAIFQIFKFVPAYDLIRNGALNHCWKVTVKFLFHIPSYLCQGIHRLVQIRVKRRDFFLSSGPLVSPVDRIGLPTKFGAANHFRNGRFETNGRT